MRGQVLGDAGSTPGQEMERGQEQLRAWCGVGVCMTGTDREWGYSSCMGFHLHPGKKGWRSPRSTLCAYPAWSREKSWLGSTPSFKPALQGSWVRPGVVSFPCARHGSTCSGWGPALAQAWGIPHHGHGTKGSHGSEGSPGTMELARGAQHHMALVPIV